MNNPQQPGKYDAVLGGNSPSIEGAAVLGGIEGVKLRLQNPDAKVRIAALEQAVNYGEQGLDLVIAGLKDESWDVQNAAYLILSDRTETKVKQALISNLQGLKLEKIEVVTTNKFGEIIQRQQRIAKYFIEDLGNGMTLEMAEIPGGTFMMGSPENEAGKKDWESPQHQVSISSFFMGKYPVTQAQYQAIMGTNPSHFKGENRPVESVGWHDAVAFCQELSQRAGKNYRLPSEAEWEYACRAGTTTPFYFGESITPELVNYDGDNPYASASKGQYRRQTTDVGIFPPNAFGLYDMHGNVWEWCQDHLRGGSWNNNPANCRSAYRYYLYLVDDSINVGFRVVCSGAART
ncbi:MAG: SUMF1/EgtB/PvdO family nonheme iron enzyme [Dolichospermum sp.]|jgi:formylglycine-generating enzyme required for sulfatase activity